MWLCFLVVAFVLVEELMVQLKAVFLSNVFKCNSWHLKKALKLDFL